MKAFICALVMLAAAGNACAIEPPPVLVIVLDDVGGKAQVNASHGLATLGIGVWANHSVNKKSARKVESFMRVLGTPEFVTRSQDAFACFATSQPCASRPAFADANLFAEAVRAEPSLEGYVVELLPELVAEQLLIRATAYRIRLPDAVSMTGTDVGGKFHALYTTRVPASLAAAKKSKVATLEAYWSDGDPRRIVSATTRGLSEINALFAMLMRGEGGGPGGATVNLNDFPDKKRLACKGALLCGMTYLHKDNGDSFVLVLGVDHAGWLDANAAAHESNLPSMETFGAPGTMLSK